MDTARESDEIPLAPVDAMIDGSGEVRREGHGEEPQRSPRGDADVNATRC